MIDIGSWFQSDATVKLKDLTHRIDFKEEDRDPILVKIYDIIKTDIEKNGYDPNTKNPIHIDSTNKVMDGNHRINIMYDLYGPDYEMTFKQWMFPVWVVGGVITIASFLEWAYIKAKALYSSYR